jgi:hypothetical protein
MGAKRLDDVVAIHWPSPNLRYLCHTFWLPVIGKEPLDGVRRRPRMNPSMGGTRVHTSSSASAGHILRRTPAISSANAGHPRRSGAARGRVRERGLPPGVIGGLVPINRRSDHSCASPLGPLMIRVPRPNSARPPYVAVLASESRGWPAVRRTPRFPARRHAPRPRLPSDRHRVRTVSRQRPCIHCALRV